MFKVFSLGIILGLCGSAAMLYAVPAVNLDREVSMISVQPNGGNVERLHVNLPGDRIMAGVAGTTGGFPAGLVWPDHLDGGPSQTEIFKVRDQEDRVIGVASRLAAGADAPFVEWTLHLPARGSVFLTLDGNLDDGGLRRGQLLGGTKEFRNREGVATERFVPADTGAGNEGRLELVTSLVSRAERTAAPAEDGE